MEGGVMRILIFVILAALLGGATPANACHLGECREREALECS
jgi:hypothetical protein